MNAPATQSQTVFSQAVPPQIEEKQSQETDQTKQSPSALYKKCFPGAASLTFKERFPVFADILGKYNQNVKKATEK